MYKTTAGKMIESRLLGNKGFDELLCKGWYCKIAKDSHETEQDLYDRLVATGYKKVKIWRRATKVVGYHDIIAMVKI